MSNLAALLPQCQEIPLANPGVYLLIRGGEVIYVGRSRDVGPRIAGHAARGRIKFDRAVYLPLPLADLAKYEGALYRVFLPSECGHGAPNRGDAEVLARFGLAATPPEAVKAHEHARRVNARVERNACRNARRRETA